MLGMTLQGVRFFGLQMSMLGYVAAEMSQLLDGYIPSPSSAVLLDK